MSYIQKLIEARVGYKFKLEELPPHLRKKIRDLEYEYATLQSEVRLYEYYKSDVENGLQKCLIQISEPYDEKISKYNSRLVDERPNEEHWKYLIYSFLWLCLGVLGIVNVYNYVSQYHQYQHLITFTLIFGFVIFFLPFLIVLAYILWRIQKVNVIKRKIADLEKEKEEALNRATDEYNSKVLPELEARVQAQEQKVKLLQEKFETELSQLCQEINSTLSIFFERRMDVDLLRSIMKSRGIVIEKIECPYCGGLMHLPETGHVTECPYCGRDVYVVDIFKKLEKFLT
jgi:Na+-transporting methylmalonyl-CoA/oxaloacetate decarboxylase gamma subunit